MTITKQDFVVLMFFFVGCNGDNVGPNNGVTPARSTLTTKSVNNHAVGFSFATGEVVPILNSSTVQADMSTLVQLNDTGKIMGVFLSAIPFRQAFRLMYESTNMDSSKIFFEHLKDFPDSTLSDLAIPVRANQVWIVKTHDDKYAKILVINTLAYDDNAVPSAPTLYGEVTFDWIYQPSGEHKF